MWAAIIAGLEAVLADPTVDAEIVAAAKTVYAFFTGPSAEAVKASLEAAGKTSDAQVADFIAGSAADLADAQARLNAALAHPDMTPALAAIVESAKAQLLK